MMKVIVTKYEYTIKIYLSKVHAEVFLLKEHDEIYQTIVYMSKVYEEVYLS